VTLVTYETEQPWVTYRYLTSDLRTRITGRSRIACECAVCGERRVLTLRIPRFGAIPDNGRHPERVRFLLDHVHADRPHPMTWARPLLDLDILAMRIRDRGAS
jgi:hypothetical protein